MEEIKTVGDYSGIIRRRIHWLIWPALLIFLIAAAVAFVLPNIYKSEAMILIEGKQVTDALVPSTVTTYADQRIQAISQQVMSRSKIMEIVDKFHLHSDIREKITTDSLVEKVKKAIGITPISAEVKSPGSNRPSLITIAFKLSFSGKNPQQVQQVTNELSSFFLAKNLQERQESAQGTTEFLEKQSQSAKTAVTNLENEISKFKKEHLEELPEFMALNLQKTEKINNDLNNMARELALLSEQRVSVQNQLAMIDPYAGIGSSVSRVLSDEEQLQQLELKKIQMMAKYSGDHPHVKAIEKEIQLLKNNGVDAQAFQKKQERLNELGNEAAALNAKYSDKHPSVKKVKAEIAALNAELQADLKKGESNNTEIKDPTNPAYVTLKSELDRIQIRLKSLENERARLNEERNITYAKLEGMPAVEKSYRELTMDYENAKTNLSELQKKLQVARIAEGMEEGQLGEKFTIIEPPFLPEEPYKPNRIAIMLIGLILGVGGGVGLAAIKEFSDRSIRRPEELLRLARYEVLSVIPNIRTPRDKRRRVLKGATVGALVTVIPAIALFIFHYYVMDLYVFSDKVLKALNERFYLNF